MKRLVTFSLMLTAFALSGCMATERLNMQDIRADQYFYKSYTIDKSIRQIAKILYDYSFKCRPEYGLAIDPATQKTAYWAHPRYFTSTPTIIGLTEFIEKDDGTTTVKAYWYYTNIDGVLSDRLIDIIRDNSTCRD